MSKTFALRIANEAKIFVNDVQVRKPEGFDSTSFKLFDLEDGISVYGNLKKVEESKTSNIQINVKCVLVEEKAFDYKVEGWVNCDHLELRTDRDGLYEGNELYVKFYKNMIQYLEENFERTSSCSKDRVLKSGKHLEKMFVEVLRTILMIDPDMAIPLMSGNEVDEQRIGTGSILQGDVASCCTLQEGFVLDPTKASELTTAKPIGSAKGNRLGDRESTARIVKGDGKILAPPRRLLAGNNLVRQLTVVELAVEGKPIVYFSPPNRFVINSKRPSSKIILEANTKDPLEMKSRVLHLLVRAGIEAFPKYSEMSKEEWSK